MATRSTKKATTKKAPATKAPAEKAPAKKAPAKKAPARKATTKPVAEKAKKPAAAEPGKPATATPKAAPRAAAPMAAGVESLEDRTLRAIRKLRRGENLVRQLRTVDAAIVACRDAGRADVATRLADGVASHSVLGRILAAPAASPADARTLLGELPDTACDQRCADEDRGAAFGRLVAAAPHLGPGDARALLDRAEAFVEAALAGTFAVKSLDATLEALAALGGRGREIARHALRRWLERGTISHGGRVKTAIHSSSADASRLGPGLIAAFLSDPELAPPIIEQNRHELGHAPVLDAMAALDDEGLARLKAAGFVSEDVARRLVQAGRRESARRLLASASPYLPDLVLLGAHDEARRLLADQPPATTARDAIVRAELGTERIADAAARLASDTTSSTAPVGELVQLGQWLVAHRPGDPDLDGLVSLAETLAQRPPRLPYDEQNVAHRQADVHLLRVAVQRARGQREAARASVEALLGALPKLQALVRAPGDRRQEAWLKDELAVAAVGAAADVGAADLALRAIEAIGKAGREGRAVAVAGRLADALPGAALAALDALASDPDVALLDASLAAPDDRLLPTLFRAVLAGRA